MGVVVKRPVSVVAIVTEAFKEECIKELQSALDRVELQMQQMEFQAKRYLMDLQKRDAPKVISTRRQLEEKREKQEALRLELRNRIEQIKQLEPGSEFTQGALETTVELNVGDNLSEKVAGAAIVLRDNIIVEIRENPKPLDAAFLSQEGIVCDEEVDGVTPVTLERVPLGTVLGLVN